MQLRVAVSLQAGTAVSSAVSLLRSHLPFSRRP